MEISYNLCNLASDVVAVWQEEENGSLVERRTPIAKAVCYADGTRSGVVNPANRGWLSRYVGSLICDGDAEFLYPVGIQTSDGYIPWDDSDTSRTQYFLRDHLGSVRVVATDKNTVIRRDDYLPFGERMTGNGLPDVSNRSSWFGFSGKENEMWPAAASTATSQPNIPHWSIGQRYQHFGARAYDPYTCSFMQVDPMAEKYYGISPYSYCAGNPAMYVDPDGEAIETLWDVANVLLGAKSFIESIQQGDVRGAVLDGGGLILDLAAVIVPGVPGGAATGIKAARTANKSYKPFTRANLRHNLEVKTGGIPKKVDAAGEVIEVDAHHLLPVKHIIKFKDAGINIHDPKFAVWFEKHDHRSKAFDYNTKWDTFFANNPNATAEQIIDYLKQLNPGTSFD